MMAQALNAYPRLLREVHEAQAERAAMMARVEALLPSEHSDLAEKLDGATAQEQQAIHRWLFMAVGAHLGIPWGTMAHLLSHVLGDTRSDYEWRGCECVEYETDDAAPAPEAR